MDCDSESRLRGTVASDLQGKVAETKIQKSEEVIQSGILPASCAERLHHSAAEICLSDSCANATGEKDVTTQRGVSDLSVRHAYGLLNGIGRKKGAGQETLSYITPKRRQRRQRHSRGGIVYCRGRAAGGFTRAH